MAIEIIAIPTARRPEALGRCVASYAENAAAYGRAPLFLISDDETGRDAAEACTGALRQTAAPYLDRVRYLGLAERLDLFRHLLRSGAPPDVVRFALFDVERCGLSVAGANRNTLALLTHGHPVLVVDDDTVCVTHVPAGYRDAPIVRAVDDEDEAGELSAGGLRDPSEWWPLGTRERGAGVCTAEPLDCLGEHERWLGRTVRECLGGNSHGHSHGGPRPDSRIRLTVNGLIGDCGWGSPTAYLSWRGASLDRLTSSEERYEDYITSRQAVRTVTRVTLSGRADFMSTFFGVDNTAVLPPFPPLGRGADHVFATLVAKCCGPHDVTAHLPVVLRHQPARPRVFWRGEIARSSSGIDLSTFFRTLIDASPGLAGASAAERLRHCGRHLQDVASRSEAEFAEIARDCIRRLLERRIEGLEAAGVARPASAPSFRRDLASHIAALRIAARREDVHVPLELLLRVPRDARAMAQRLLLQFGRLLAEWPALLEAARGAPWPRSTTAIGV